MKGGKKKHFKAENKKNKPNTCRMSLLTKNIKANLNVFDLWSSGSMFYWVM